MTPVSEMTVGVMTLVLGLFIHTSHVCNGVNIFSPSSSCAADRTVSSPLARAALRPRPMDGGIEALRTFRKASDFFSEKWPEDGDPGGWEGIKVEAGKVIALKVPGTYSARNRLPFLPADVQILTELKILEVRSCSRTIAIISR